VQTLARVTVQGDTPVTKDIVDETVHGGFFKGTSLSAVALERGGAFDFFRQEVVDV
jgi:hypothetical protein